MAKVTLSLACGSRYKKHDSCWMRGKTEYTENSMIYKCSCECHNTGPSEDIPW